MTDDTRWRWRFSRWWGFMWGPIPVSLIIIIIVLTTILVVGYSME